MAPGRSMAAYDRASERRRAVALAHHFREAQGLTIAQISDRLGRLSTTVKAYFYDPTGEKDTCPTLFQVRQRVFDGEAP